MHICEEGMPSLSLWIFTGISVGIQGNIHHEMGAFFIT